MEVLRAWLEDRERAENRTQPKLKRLRRALDEAIEEVAIDGEQAFADALTEYRRRVAG